MSPLGRGKPLRRSTGLPRGTKPLKPGPPPVRHSPLRSTSPLSSGTPRPTPVRPQRPSGPGPAERRAREMVRARAGEHSACEICGQRPGREWSHRQPRSGSGAWCPSNGLWACNDLAAPDGRHGCHQFCHRFPVEARSMGWVVRRRFDPAVVPVRLALHGFVLLDTDGGWSPTDLRPEELSA